MKSDLDKIERELRPQMRRADRPFAPPSSGSASDEEFQRRLAEHDMESARRMALLRTAIRERSATMAFDHGVVLHELGVVGAAPSEPLRVKSVSRLTGMRARLTELRGEFRVMQAEAQQATRGVALPQRDEALLSSRLVPLGSGQPGE